MISAVLPTLNESACLPDLLGDLAGRVDEIVVADGGSTDSTESIAKSGGCVWVAAPRGRGHQLAAGARAARGDVLLFIHADARPPATLRADIESTLARPETALGAFHLKIAARRRPYRWIESWANARSRRLGLPYGDQGLFLTRAVYDRIGGFRDLPIMEDVDLVRRAARLGRIALAPSSILVSPRRWEREGLLAASLRNLALFSLYTLGFPPSLLARWYRPAAD